MANEVEVKLGTFDLDSSNGIALSDVSFRASKAITTHPLAKHSGSVAAIGKFKDIKVNLRGTITGSDYDALRTELDSLRAALYSASDIKFTIDDDRYMNAVVQGYGMRPVNQAIRTLWDFDIALVVPDPFWLSETLNSVDSLTDSNTSISITNAGNYPARAKITVTGLSEIADDLLIENATTGEAIQYRGTLAIADELVVNNRVDDRDIVVTNGGDDDIVNMEGNFITLDPGSNTLNLTTGTSDVTVEFEWRDTYLA